ncbi:hypothetical protein GR210_09630 [Rhizobium leguminosarum]|uniref:hypothetical protein n=1 Tax=Rhizobium leguminosarum TaxID=384 RepID=UPI0013D97289|nr:hypothetical protein [Rhizobium leguminosarum]MBY5312698.1 hypothetical protein [Rhizobium leguminosarum]NEH49055.1 hypothetical protein [Rhizobium leguminosarum]
MAEKSNYNIFEIKWFHEFLSAYKIDNVIRPSEAEIAWIFISVSGPIIAMVVEQIVKAVSDEFANSNKSQRLRALQRVQDIPEETMKILSNGKYKKNDRSSY